MYRFFRGRGLLWVGVVVFALGLLLPGFFGGFISGAIYNTQGDMIKSDYRFFWSNGNGENKYVLELPLAITTNRIFQLYPNDCVKKIIVNHKEYSELTGDLCNYRDGIPLYLQEYLQLGTNIIQVDISESGNSKALILKPSVLDPVRLYSFLLLGVGLFTCLYYLFSGWFVFDKKNKHRLFWCTFLIMFVVGLMYMINTDYFKRSHDLSGHLDYMKLLLRGRPLVTSESMSYVIQGDRSRLLSHLNLFFREQTPVSDACWQCYHPNTYYRFSEVVYNFGRRIGRADPFELMRWITYVGWWLGVLFVFRFFYKLFITKSQRYSVFVLACILFAFRPTQFYYGSRITNDVWYYMLTFIALYHSLVAWFAYQERNDQALRKHTVIGVLLLMCGLYIKSNSIVWLPLALLGFICRIFTGKLWLNIIYWRKAIFTLFLVFLLGFGGIFWISSVKSIQGIVDNADRLNAGNSVAYVPVYEAFTSFYAKPFITYLAMWDENDDSERRSFWNFLLKTSITGEMGVMMDKNVVFFPYFMIVGLLLYILLFVRICLHRSINLFMVSGYIVPLIAMMVYRVIYPLAASMHHRYILPQLLFIVYYSIAWLGDVGSYKELRVIDRFHIIVVVLFVLGSIVFSIPPYF